MNINIYTEATAIEIDRIQSDITLMANLVSVYEETNDVENQTKASSGLTVGLQKFFEKIRQFFEDAMEMFSNMFSRKKELTAEEFFKDPTVKINIQSNIKEIQAEIQAEMREGNAILQKLANTTGIPDDVIDNWMNKTAKTLNSKLERKQIQGALAWEIRKNIIPNIRFAKKNNEEAKKIALTIDLKNAAKAEAARQVSAQLFKLGKFAVKQCKDYGSAIFAIVNADKTLPTLDNM